MKTNFAFVKMLPAVLLIAGALAADPTPSPPPPPAAGVIPLGVTVIQMHAVVAGWSVKKDILGKHVQNSRKEDLGKIEDIIITPKDQAAFAIIGVGGFLGIAEELVAIPAHQLKPENGYFLLAGATKAVLRAMPPFVYAH